MEQHFFSRLQSKVESADISYGSLNPASVGIYIQTFKKINVADDGMSFWTPQTSSFTPQSRTFPP